MTTTTARTEKLDLRLSSAAKKKLFSAAAAAHRSVTDFVLESALSRADETLAERQWFGLTAERWDEFMAALDAPARELPRIKALFDTPSLFEGPTEEPATKK
jgi:uncharacterized protein (DUF1778 family)